MRDYPLTKAKTRTAWRTWLTKHHTTSTGVWLVFAKKGSGIASVGYVDAVEEALCFGWIDSIVKRIDDQFHQQLFTPRKAKSVWSASNKERVARMIADGAMTPAGLALIEHAKKIGTWDTLVPVDAGTMPPELSAALAGNAAAKKHWPSYSASARKQFLYWLTAAKRPETRANRVAKIIALVESGTTLVQLYWATKSGDPGVKTWQGAAARKAAKKR